jgi:competence protein ComEA
MKFLIILILSVTFAFATVNINSANVKEFTTLKGIGTKKAKAIVKFRKTIQCFKSIDELTKVKGIGKATISKNRENLKLGRCKK